MRLLFLSNLLPPASLGGYEAWCLETAVRLRGRGHTLTVLTSDYRRAELRGDPDWVRRELELEMPLVSLRNGLTFFTSRRGREAANLRRLRQTLDAAQPDAVLIWGMWNLHRSLAAEAERLMGDRVSYYLSDYWPALPGPFADYWSAPARGAATALVKAALRPAARRQLAGETRPSLAFAYAMTPSAFVGAELRRQGIPLGDVEVVRGGIDVRRFAAEAQPRASGGNGEGPTLLYVGRLTPEKGIVTAIEALGIARRQLGLSGVRLVVAGGGAPPYEARLQAMAGNGPVTFMGPQPEAALPGLYQSAAAVLFPSIWPEPFARVPLEAMASGTPVIGTTTGGSAELFRDGENALVFPVGDAGALARAVDRLWADPGLAARLAEVAGADVRARHDIERMVDGIEAHLLRLAGVADGQRREEDGRSGE